LIQLPHAHRFKPTHGNSWKGKHFSLWLAEQETPGEPTEWMIVVNRKTVRLATERNRWKRRVREVLREQEGSIRPGYRVRLKLHTKGAKAGYPELQREILELIKRSGLLSS